MRDPFSIGLTVYLLIATITFGYAAANAPATRINTFTGESVPTDVEIRAMGGFLAAAAWPLYWSWTAFEPAVDA